MKAFKWSRVFLTYKWWTTTLKCERQSGSILFCIGKLITIWPHNIVQKASYGNLKNTRDITTVCLNTTDYLTWSLVSSVRCKQLVLNIKEKSWPTAVNSHNMMIPSYNNLASDVLNVGKLQFQLAASLSLNRKDWYLRLDIFTGIRKPRCHPSISNLGKGSAIACSRRIGN